MSEKKEEKLGAFLREVSNWSWEEFVRAEKDETYSSNEAIIFAIIRSCAMQKLDAIKMSLNRLDGKLKTPIQIEYPKFYTLYPNAKLTSDDSSIIDESEPLHLPGPIVKVTDDPNTVNEVEVITQEQHDQDSDDTTDLPSLSLRETLDKMATYPRELPKRLTERALEIEQYLNTERPFPEDYDIPRVKSVVAAHLLTMAADRNLAAASEVFDQIDGKLAETIQLLGEDVYTVDYSPVAPPEAMLNEEGIYQVEASDRTAAWAIKLKEIEKL